MSALTIFLAKLLGLYCIIFALVMMVRGSRAVATTVKALVANPPLLMFVELIGLAGGLAMVIGHNIWTGGVLTVAVTLIGWLIVIRSVILLAMSPEVAVKLIEALQYEKYFYLYMGGTLILGLWLAYAGFNA